MAVKIRLTRKGAKKNAFYRIVVADSRYARDGRFLENVGTYDPKLEDNKTVLKMDRIQHWLERGATPTDTVKSLLKETNAG